MLESNAILNVSVDLGELQYKKKILDYFEMTLLFLFFSLQLCVLKTALD